MRTRGATAWRAFENQVQEIRAVMTKPDDGLAYLDTIRYGLALEDKAWPELDALTALSSLDNLFETETGQVAHEQRPE